MVSHNVIIKRLEKLEQAIKRLEQKKSISLEEFKKNWETQDVVLREFQVAIEACIDISNHIISEKGWESPEKYTDVADILCKHGVIPEEFSGTLRKMIAFRNTIIYEYAEIDLEAVHLNLSRPDDLRRFASYVTGFFEKELSTNS